MLSDPRRSESDVLIGPAVGGNGASGPRIGGFGWLSGKTVTLCAVGDLYCSTPKDDFVMRLAGFMAQASDPTPASALALRDEAAVIVNDLITAGGLPALMAPARSGREPRGASISWSTSTARRSTPTTRVTSLTAQAIRLHPGCTAGWPARPDQQ